jgi:bifunctional non-homologous end joining protein LigD
MTPARTKSEPGDDGAADKLATYRGKRSADKTPEPMGRGSAGAETGPRAKRDRVRKRRFVEAPEGFEPLPSSVAPMLAVAGELPKNDTDWSYEFKWDGVRAVATVDGGRIRLVSRNGNDLTGAFPELRALGETLGSRQVVLDGEIVAFDGDRRPSFQRLQPRIHAASESQARRRAEAQPVSYVLFDVMYAEGRSLLDEPYLARRKALEGLRLEGPNWSVSPRFDGPGADILAASRSQGLEGVLAKSNDSPYLPGRRSPAWIKVKNLRTQEVVVGGYTPGEGNRRGRLGSLLLGIPEGSGALGYVGQVGTGFDAEALSELGELLASRERESSPFAGKVPANYAKRATWVEPDLVGEVSFSEWTKEGRLRQPSWRGLREDKSPREVVRES